MKAGYINRKKDKANYNLGLIEAKRQISLSKYDILIPNEKETLKHHRL